MHIEQDEPSLLPEELQGIAKADNWRLVQAFKTANDDGIITTGKDLQEALDPVSIHDQNA